MTILWGLKKNPLSNLPNKVSKASLSGESRQARRLFTARLNPCLSLDSLFLNLLRSVKASGAAKIGHLKNLIWTSLIRDRLIPADFLRQIGLLGTTSIWAATAVLLTTGIAAQSYNSADDGSPSTTSRE